MKHVAIIVAHPNDETLWTGGLILSKPHWRCFIIALCRGDNINRSQRFYNALKVLRVNGVMGQLEGELTQDPLPVEVVENEILKLLPSKLYDLIITHSPAGEYTRHLRHEETGAAVIAMWLAGKITTKKLWAFAYEDGNKAYFPRSKKDATINNMLTKRLWQKKHDILIHTYGFKKSSWEVRVTPKNESFHEFTDASQAMQWSSKLKKQHV